MRKLNYITETNVSYNVTVDEIDLSKHLVIWKPLSVNYILTCVHGEERYAWMEQEQGRYANGEFASIEKALEYRKLNEIEIYEI